MSVRRVLILGAGGLGREVFHWALDAGMEPIGFIDDAPDALAGLQGYPPIVGGVDNAPVETPILCAIGRNDLRVACVERLTARGATFADLLHPQAKILRSDLGPGAVIAPFAYIGADAATGPFPFLQTGAVLGHDVRAGAFLRMDTTAFVGGHARLGDRVTLHTGAKVMPGKTVGDECTLGAGAVLLSNLRSGATAFGVPAMTC